MLAGGVHSPGRGLTRPPARPRTLAGVTKPARDQSTPAAGLAAESDKLPIRMLHDRVLVLADSAEGERRSMAGIVIPATARMGKRLSWAEVVGVGQNVRVVEIGDRVLFDPEDRFEVEVRGVDYLLLRERDLHAVAANRLADGSPGLYL
jgi:chaperonin GroES